MIVLSVVAAVAYLAAVAEAIALGVALADRAAYKRTLERVREQRDQARAERNAAVEAGQFSPDVQVPVWTEGAPQEAIDAEFDSITHEGWIRGESS
jgi:hypothetical protein